MATTVYLIRHGETQWNRNFLIQGQRDIELNEAGKAQAALLAKRLERVPLDAIYSSDLSRAAMTAEAIGLPHGLSVNLTAQFREINFGEWEGMSWSEIDVRYPGARDMLRADPEAFRPPGGETWGEVSDRVYQGLTHVASEWPDGRVAVVSHGGSGRMAICRVLGIDYKLRWKIRMDNTGISILVHDGGEWTVSCINDTCHLDVCAG